MAALYKRVADIAWPAPNVRNKTRKDVRPVVIGFGGSVFDAALLRPFRSCYVLLNSRLLELWDVGFTSV